MSDHDGNIETVLRGFSALAAGDFAAMLPLLDAEVVFDESGTLPDSPIFHGHDGFWKWVGEVRERWSELEVTPVRAFAPGPDRVIVELHARMRGRRGAVPAEQELVQMFELRDGLVVRVTSHPSAEAAEAAALES